MNKKTVVCLVVVLLGLGIADPAYGEDDHAGHGHDTSGIELGLSVGYVHLDEEDEDSLGLHVHLSKRLGHEGLLERLGLGVGGEVIFAEHEHYSLLFPLAMYPWRGLILAVAPGIEWAEHDEDWETAYATHLEAAYVFEIGDYDVGPVVDYSKSDNDEHYMIGIHLGIHL